MEYAYKNSYHNSIQVAPFEVLYGRPCHTPLRWDRLEDRVMLGPKMLQEMEEQMEIIKQRLKEARGCQKSYADANIIDRSFEEGIQVFIRVKPSKGSFIFCKGIKLSARFFGPFQILERLGLVAYKLELSIPSKKNG